MALDIQQLQRLQGPATVGLEGPSAQIGSALDRLDSAGGQVGAASPDPMTGLSQSGVMGALAQALQGLMGQFSHKFLEQAISKQSQEVLALKANPEAGSGQEQLSNKVNSLSRDYESAKTQNVPLSHGTEQLAKQALGLDDQANASAPAAAQAPSASTSNGGASPAASASSSSSPSTPGRSQEEASEASGSRNDSGSPDLSSATWSQNQDVQLQKALQEPDGRFHSEFSGFDQTVEGNCASVAVIKSAMDTYGAHVFEDVQRDQSGQYHVTMQDGFQTSVTPSELAQADKAAKFGGDEGDARSYAVLMYASMAKRAASEGYDGKHTFQEELKSFASGEDPHDAARFLGLQNNVQELDPTQLQGRSGVVAWNARHAVFVDSTSQGEKADHYGSAVAFDGTDTNQRALTDAFTFKPREQASATRPGSGASRPAEKPGAPTAAARTRTAVSPASRRSSTSAVGHTRTVHKTSEKK